MFWWVGNVVDVNDSRAILMNKIINISPWNNLRRFWLHFVRILREIIKQHRHIFVEIN